MKLLFSFLIWGVDIFFEKGSSVLGISSHLLGVIVKSGLACSYRCNSWTKEAAPTVNTLLWN